MNKKQRAAKHTETHLVQSLHFFDKETGGIIPGIDFSTTFVRDKNYQPSGDFIYAREGNATTAEAEKILKVLDNSEDTLLFSSGMSGLSTLMDVLESGDHIIVQDPIYYAISRYLEYICPRRGIEISRIKAEEIYDAESILAMIYPENNHIKDKIRQQLQIMRENKNLEFVNDSGVYRRIK